MRVKFYKLTGAGNDFIAVNNLENQFPEGSGRLKFIKDISPRGIAIGADGVLFIEPSEHHDFRMRYYNADGSEAGCGNGSRCIARLANLLGIAGETMSFESYAGIYHATVKDESVIVDVTPPRDLSLDVSISVPSFNDTLDFINTGVPHTVIFTDELETTDVVGIGRQIRFADIFKPDGTNVNFITVTSPSSLRIRTYERGVENETLACGTGAMAAAIIAGKRGKVSPPVDVITKMGIVLKIHYTIDGDKVSNVRLEGEARLVYTGEFEYEWQD